MTLQCMGIKKNKKEQSNTSSETPENTSSPIFLPSHFSATHKSAGTSIIQKYENNDYGAFFWADQSSIILAVTLVFNEDKIELCS